MITCIVLRVLLLFPTHSRGFPDSRDRSLKKIDRTEAEISQKSYTHHMTYHMAGMTFGKYIQHKRRLYVTQKTGIKRYIWWSRAMQLLHVLIKRENSHI